MGVNLTPEEKVEVFGDHDPDAYAHEVEERWGGSDAYRESRRRSASYTKEDWQRIQAQADVMTRRFVALLESGVAPESPAAMDAAEAHRGWISANHYACSYEIHVGLAEMYVADERFTRNIDRIKPGLAAFQQEAMLANADRNT